LELNNDRYFQNLFSSYVRFEPRFCMLIVTRDLRTSSYDLVHVRILFFEPW